MKEKEERSQEFIGPISLTGNLLVQERKIQVGIIEPFDGTYIQYGSDGDKYNLKHFW